MEVEVKGNSKYYKYNGRTVGIYEVCKFDKVHLWLWRGDDFVNEGYMSDDDAKNYIEKRRQLFILEGFWK